MSSTAPSLQNTTKTVPFSAQSPTASRHPQFDSSFRPSRRNCSRSVRRAFCCGSWCPARIGDLFRHLYDLSLVSIRRSIGNFMDAIEFFDSDEAELPRSRGTDDFEAFLDLMYQGYLGRFAQLQTADYVTQQ